MRRLLPALLALCLLCACAAEPAPPEQDTVPVAAVSGASVALTGLVEVSSLEASSAPAETGPTYQIAVPQLRYRGKLLPAADAAVQINTYYADLAELLLSYVTEELATQPPADGQQPYLIATFSVAYLKEGARAISIVRYLESDTGSVAYGETFSLETGGLLILDDFFTEDEDAYLPVVLDALAAALDAGTFSYDAATLAASFDRNAFYVTEDQLVFLYPEATLRDAPTEIAVDFSALGDSFALPDCFT